MCSQQYSYRVTSIVTRDVTSEFIISLHLVKSLHQLRFSYLNFLLKFESTFKTSFPYFFSISTRYFNVLVTSKKKTCPRTVSQIWLFDGGFKEKIAVPHRIIPEATRQVIIIVRQNPCILHPGEYTVSTLRAKNLTPPPPPNPKKKKKPPWPGNGRTQTSWSRDLQGWS